MLAALASQASPHLASRYRAHRLAPLIARYYEKAKGGVAKRKQVITKAFQRDLSAFFGGDWLRFLGYLGEQPHPEEQIDSALPEIKLMVSSTKSAASVAESLGLPPKKSKRPSPRTGEKATDRVRHRQRRSNNAWPSSSSTGTTSTKHTLCRPPG